MINIICGLILFAITAKSVLGWLSLTSIILNSGLVILEVVGVLTTFIACCLFVLVLPIKRSNLEVLPLFPNKLKSSPTGILLFIN